MKPEYIVIAAGVFLLLWVWRGMARCRYCRKMRMDGHAVGCLRHVRPKVRFY